MPERSSYILGTRGSLLAVTQSTLIKRELEKLTGKRFKLLTIKTEGDQKTDKPLWQLEGKDFFTKELDDALINGKTDLTVHSYKDLGSDRPDKIQLAAITKREYAHDILLIRDEVVGQLNEIEEIVVGTSSPRRITNIEAHLAEYLPHPNLQVKTKMLRGNVNTRIQKLRDGNFDAIVLALAGLERLALKEESKLILEELLSGLKFIVLPLSTFPASASQGALAIECNAVRDDNGELYQYLQKLHHPTTAEEVSREREAFNKYGGGCHLSVGIHVKKVNECFLHTHRGVHQNKTIDKFFLEGSLPSKPTHSPCIFIGLPPNKKVDRNNDQIVYDEFINKEEIPTQAQDSNESDNLFITSSYCLNALKKMKKGNSLWAAGNKTFKKLVANGHFINGSSDSLGKLEIEKLMKSKTIQILLKHKTNLLTLTSDLSESNNTIACYKRTFNPLDEKFTEKISRTKVFYWTSFFQYQKYMEKFPFLQDADRQHCAGLGRTLHQLIKELQKRGKQVIPYTSINSFLENNLK